MKKVLLVALLFPALALSLGAQRGTKKALSSTEKAISRGPCTVLPATTNLLGNRTSPVGWSPTNADVSADVAFAPDATFRADKLVETAVTGGHSVMTTVSLVSGTTYVMSFYAKSAERNQINFYGGGGLASITARVNLDTGAVLAGTAVVESAGDGWWRISDTGASTFTGANSVTLALYNGGGTYAGAAGSGVYVYGVQLEAGSTPNPFVDTANGIRTAGCY